MQSLKKYLSEFIGTLVLVLFNCGVVAVSGCKGHIFDGAYVMSALGFGLVIAVMYYIFGDISGSHLNPSVSIARLITGSLSVKDFIGYLISQFSGAAVGAALLWYFIGSRENLGQNTLHNENEAKSIIIDIVLTFVYVMTVLGVSSKVSDRTVSGVASGGALALVHLFGIYFTGTSVNPARSFGPAVFVGGAALSCLWVFIVAPLLGGILAALVHGFINKSYVKEQ